MSGGQIWNRQTRYYDPGVNPQPHGPNYRRSGTYHGARAKHDGLDGFTLDKSRLEAARAKRARKNESRRECSTRTRIGAVLASSGISVLGLRVKPAKRKRWGWW